MKKKKFRDHFDIGCTSGTHCPYFNKGLPANSELRGTRTHSVLNMVWVIYCGFFPLKCLYQIRLFIHMHLISEIYGIIYLHNTE